MLRSRGDNAAVGTTDNAWEKGPLKVDNLHLPNLLRADGLFQLPTGGAPHWGDDTDLLGRVRTDHADCGRQVAVGGDQ